MNKYIIILGSQFLGWPGAPPAPARYGLGSAVQSTKVLREPIRTTEKWRWKNFSALRVD